MAYGRLKKTKQVLGNRKTSDVMTLCANAESKKVFISLKYSRCWHLWTAILVYGNVMFVSSNRKHIPDNGVMSI